MVRLPFSILSFRDGFQPRAFDTAQTRQSAKSNGDYCTCYQYRRVTDDECHRKGECLPQPSINQLKEYQFPWDKDETQTLKWRAEVWTTSQ